MTTTPDGSHNSSSRAITEATVADGVTPLEGPLWENPLSITYAWAQWNLGGDQFSDIIASEVYKNIVRQAMAAWESVANVHFVEAPDVESAYNDVDVRIGFSSLDAEKLGLTSYWTDSYGYFHNDVRLYLEDPAIGSTQGYVPGVVVDDFTKDIDDRFYVSGSASVYQVALHELGHALGLDHITSDPSDVMYPILANLLYGDNRWLTKADIKAVQSLYGSPPPNVKGYIALTGGEGQSGSIFRLGAVTLHDTQPNETVTATVTVFWNSTPTLLVPSGHTSWMPGTLSNFGAGTVSAEGTSFTVTGHPAEVENAIRQLEFIPSSLSAPAGTTNIFNELKLSVANGGHTLDSVYAINEQASISIAGRALLNDTGDAPISPFSGISVIDPDPQAALIATISLWRDQAETDSNGVHYGTIDGTVGMLSGTDIAKVGDGVYRISALSDADLTSKLQELIFTAAPFPAGEATELIDFTISATDTTGHVALAQSAAFATLIKPAATTMSSLMAQADVTPSDFGSVKGVPQQSPMGGDVSTVFGSFNPAPVMFSPALFAAVRTEG